MVGDEDGSKGVFNARVIQSSWLFWLFHVALPYSNSYIMTA